MSGLYLYCIREKAHSKFSVKGIDGKGDVFIISYRNLEALVSEVSLEEFNGREIKHEALENINWIKEKAQRHEIVVEEAMRSDGESFAVIPMSFGTIFQSREKIQRSLVENYSKFENILAGLQGKQEWSVKVYLVNREALEAEIKNRNEAVKAKEKEMAVMPTGRAYFFEKEIAELITSEIDREIQKYTNGFFLSFSKFAHRALEGKILDRELTGKIEPMVLNAIYLIQRQKIEGFKRKVERLSRKMEPKGFGFEYSGPWPPYHFVER